MYHNVRHDFGLASQNRSIAPLQFHLAQPAGALAAAGQFEVEDAGAQRRLVDQRSGRHLGHNIGGLEANRGHDFTVRLASS